MKATIMILLRNMGSISEIRNSSDTDRQVMLEASSGRSLLFNLPYRQKSSFREEIIAKMSKYVQDELVSTREPEAFSGKKREIYHYIQDRLNPNKKGEVPAFLHTVAEANVEGVSFDQKLNVKGEPELNIIQGSLSHRPIGSELFQ